MVWAEMPSSTTQNLQDVWGAGVNNLWAVGKAGHSCAGRACSGKTRAPTSARSTTSTRCGAVVPMTSGRSASRASSCAGTAPPGPEVPSGSNQPLKDIWGTSKSDVWTVGESGVILHWNGNDWSPVPSGTETELRGIWGSSPRDIWAVGGSDASEGFILHYDGAKWQPHYRAETRLNYLWGSAAEATWAVGGRPSPEGTVVHWDGKEWRPVGIPRAPWLNSIWGSGPRDIWVAGDSGTILHYNGTAWAEAVTATQMTFKSVYGTGPNDVWAVAFNGIIRHWNGKTWVPMVSNTQQSLRARPRQQPTDVWALGKNRHHRALGWQGLGRVPERQHQRSARHRRQRLR